MRSLLAWLLLILAFAGTAAHAALPPRPDSPVLDRANIIPDADEAALDTRLKAYTAATGRALMVVTVSSLEGQDIASFGSALGQQWGVGGKATDLGLILIVAPSERKVRIEVGYGLEEYLPDVLAARIVREIITPKFKTGDFAGGISAGMAAVMAQLDRTPADAKAVAEAAAAAARTDGNGEASAGGVIFWIVLILAFMFIFGRGGRRRGRRYDGGGMGAIAPIIIFDALSHMGGRGGGGLGGGFGGGGGGGWGGFGGGGFGGGGASGDW